MERSEPVCPNLHPQLMSAITKFLIVALLAYFVVWPWLRRRWPDFTRRLNFALIAALIAVVLFRVVVHVSRNYLSDGADKAGQGSP